MAGEADLLPVPLEAVAVQAEVEVLEVEAALPVAEVAVVVVVEAEGNEGEGLDEGLRLPFFLKEKAKSFCFPFGLLEDGRDLF